MQPDEQRQSSRSSRTPEKEPGEASSSKRSQETSNQASRRRGSSRDTSEMQFPSTPPQASSPSTKYTRTGRVSKATKGQRVHHCEECGKTYTRAEHLRRHQQNHKPGAFPCDWPNCGRSFYREDLLTRHKARHNDPNNPPSRRHSVGSQSSAADIGRLIPGSSQASTALHSIEDTALSATEIRSFATDTGTQQPSTTTRYQLFTMSLEPEPLLQFFHGLSLNPKRVPIPPNELRIGMPVAVHGSPGFGSFANPWEPSPPLSPRSCSVYDYDPIEEASDLPYYQPQLARARTCSETSFTGYTQPHNTSNSLESGGSSTYLPQWSFAMGHYLPDWNALPSEYSIWEEDFLPSYSCGDSRSTTAEARDFLERNELTVLDIVSGSLISCEDDESQACPVTNHYLDAYWLWIHELFPIIHKPTFDHETASPLLRAAVLAFGAQASGDRADLENAHMLHEKCLKVLKMRTLQDIHTFRVCDMQAIILIEAYSIFKSRRPPQQLSQHFENVYRLLPNYSIAMIPLSSNALTDTNSFTDMLADNAICRQRLLLTCYILEHQYNLLFGRPLTTCFHGANLNLPFPCDQSQWDRLAEAPYRELYERTCEALGDLHFLTERQRKKLDHFQSLLLMTCRIDIPHDSPAWADPCEDFPILQAAEQTPRTLLAYHTYMLCNNTPLRDLLAVTGESWTMAEKVGSQAETTASQIEVRQWAAMEFSSCGLQRPAVQEALLHAFAILRIQQQTPKTGLLFQEWTIHLAAIVIWARFYCVSATERSHQPRLRITTQLAESPQLEAYEQDPALATLISDHTFVDTLEWEDIRLILIWTKGTIEKKHTHGLSLSSRASNVLDQLITRGNEEGWF